MDAIASLYFRQTRAYLIEDSKLSSILNCKAVSQAG